VFEELDVEFKPVQAAGDVARRGVALLEKHGVDLNT